MCRCCGCTMRSHKEFPPLDYKSSQRCVRRDYILTCMLSASSALPWLGFVRVPAHMADACHNTGVASQCKQRYRASSSRCQARV